MCLYFRFRALFEYKKTINGKTWAFMRALILRKYWNVFSKSIKLLILQYKRSTFFFCYIKHMEFRLFSAYYEILRSCP